MRRHQPSNRSPIQHPSPPPLTTGRGDSVPPEEVAPAPCSNGTWREGKELKLEIEGSMTVEELKAKIESTEHIAPEQLRLLFGDCELKRGKTLCDYNVNEARRHTPPRPAETVRYGGKQGHDGAGAEADRHEPSMGGAGRGWGRAESA